MNKESLFTEQCFSAIAIKNSNKKGGGFGGSPPENKKFEKKGGASGGLPPKIKNSKKKGGASGGLPPKNEKLE